MSFEELTHPADVRIRVRSPSLPSLFSEAARGMFQVMYGGCSGDDVEVTFPLEADDQDALMHDFLSELLYLSDARGIVFCSFEVRIEDTSLHATVRGIPFDPARHAGGREIKGVSYSGLRIVKEEESYCMDVIFDV